MRLRPIHAVLVLAVVLLLLLVPMPHMGRIARALGDLAHVPVGGLVALAAYALLSKRMPRSRIAAAILAFVLSVVLLALVEILQPLVGRGRSQGDLVAGALGAAGALAIMLAWGRPRASRLAFGLVGVVLLAVACLPTGRVIADVLRQKSELPILASFEDDLEMTRWWFDDAEGTRGGEHTTHGLWSLRVEFAPAQYPSATLAHPYADWTGFRALALDVFVDGDEPLELILKVVDRWHDHTYADRFQKKLLLAPGPHVVSVPLEAVQAAPKGRAMDLSHVRSVQLFVDDLKTPRTIHLDAVRLTR